MLKHLFFASCIGSTLAQSGLGTYSLKTTIPWTPSAPSSVDQSTVFNNRYYLGDRSNSGVHVISATNFSQIALVGPFIATKVNGSIVSSESGPGGVVVVDKHNELWVGDGKGLIRVISMDTNRFVANVSTGSTKRADEFAYDSKTDTVIATNPDEDIPYVSVINAANRTVLGRVYFNNASGLEQPAFNPANGKFYVSVPSSGAHPGGFVATINLANFSVADTFPLPNCEPAGIVFGPNQNLFVSCSQDQINDFGLAQSYVISGVNGAILANISGVSGVDQVTYNKKLNAYYASAYQFLEGGKETGAPKPFLAVIDAGSNKLVQSLGTDNVTAHSVATDPCNGNVFVPIKNKGIVVLSRAGQRGNGTIVKAAGPRSAPSLSVVAAINLTLAGLLSL